MVEEILTSYLVSTTPSWDLPYDLCPANLFISQRHLGCTEEQMKKQGWRAQCVACVSKENCQKNRSPTYKGDGQLAVLLENHFQIKFIESLSYSHGSRVTLQMGVVQDRFF